jgi:hypothetical protein
MLGRTKHHEVPKRLSDQEIVDWVAFGGAHEGRAVTQWDLERAHARIIIALQDQVNALQAKVESNE